MRSSVVVCPFFCFLSLFQENWRSVSVSFPRGIFASDVCQVCILTRIYPFSGSQRLASICLVASSLIPFWLGLLCRALALRLNRCFFDSFVIETFAHSPTYMAFTNSKDLKEHSIAFSSAFTYGALDEVAAIISSSVAMQTSYPSVTNLIF